MEQNLTAEQIKNLEYDRREATYKAAAKELFPDERSDTLFIQNTDEWAKANELKADEAEKAPLPL